MDFPIKNISENRNSGKDRKSHVPVQQANYFCFHITFAKRTLIKKDLKYLAKYSFYLHLPGKQS